MEISEALDVSKAFDRIWHEGLIYKLMTIVQSFLDNRYQRVLLNGENSHWEPIKAGMSQGSVLRLLLFLIYINDLPDNLISNVKLFFWMIHLFFQL